MVRLLLTAAALVAALGGTAAASDNPPDQTSDKPPAPVVDKKSDPSGIYLCEGVNPDGNKYRGIVQIAAVRNTFLVRWTLADDIEVTGVGILHDGLLSVSYFGGTPAVVVYKIDADKLVGQWTMGGTEGAVFAETLTPMPEGMLTPRPSQDPGTTPGRRPKRATPLPGTLTI